MSQFEVDKSPPTQALNAAGLVDPEFFQQQFIGPLLNLERDPVANVRMALARMLAAADLTNLPEAVEVLKRLAQDPDRYETLLLPMALVSHSSFSGANSRYAAQ